MNNVREFQSFSSLSTFLRCPMQYYFRYCEGIKAPPAVALLEGSAGHKGNEANYKQKIDTRKDLPVDDVLDAVSTEFDARAPEVEDWEGQKKGEVKDGIVKLMRLVHKVHYPTVQPVECEKEYVVEVQGSTLKVYRDLKDEAGYIRDSKFVKRARSQGDADKDLQLTIYSYCDRTDKVAFDCFVKGKTNKVAVVESRRTNEDWTRLERMVPALLTAIESGSFYPCDPASWSHSPDYCGYWNICPYGGKNTNPVQIDLGREDSIL